MGCRAPSDRSATPTLGVMSSEQNSSADQPVSVVTGANSGIGRATAIHLARQGHRVIGTVRSIDKADKLRNMAADADVEVELFELDIADDESVKVGFERILEATGRVDHLVNNAGVGGNAVAEECPTELYLSVMNVNLCGAVRCIQAVLPQMRERRSGTIVNITSVTGRIAALAQSPYVASKWAFEGLSEGLAQELWAFLAQPNPLPERLISADPVFYLDHTLASWTKGRSTAAFAPDALAEYRKCFSSASAVHGACEDYRAGATLDRAHDEESRASGRDIACPTLVLWGTEGTPASTGDPLAIWRNWPRPSRARRSKAGTFSWRRRPSRRYGRCGPSSNAEVSGPHTCGAGSLPDASVARTWHDAPGIPGVVVEPGAAIGVAGQIDAL